MKKMIYKIGVSLLAVIIMAGCSDDFFDYKPYGKLDINTLGNKEGISKLLIGAYSMLDGYTQNDGGGFGGASAMNWIFGEIAADNAYKGDQTGPWAGIIDIERYIPSSVSNEFIDEAWKVNYDAVARCNDVLRVLYNAEGLEDEFAKQAEAQARFLRAYFHFQIRLKFRMMPYITDDVDPTTIPNDDETGVWDKMEADLKWCIDPEHELNKDWGGDAGRATYWAAKSLLARVHMFQKEWTDAAGHLDEVITEGGFSLENHFYNNFDEDYQNNGESILEVQNSVGDGADPHNAGSDHQTLYPNPQPFGQGFDYCPPSFSLFNAYKVDDNGLPLIFDGDYFLDDLLQEDMNVPSNADFTPTDHLLDPRVDWTIARRGIPFLDWGIHQGASWKRFQEQMGPFAHKKVMFWQKNLETTSPNPSGHWSPGVNANNVRIIRYGHVLLWRAECAVELDDLSTALTYVNDIRERAADEDTWVKGKAYTSYQRMDDTITADLTVFRSDSVLISGKNYIAVPRVDSSAYAANYRIGLYASFPDKEYARKAVHFETRIECALEGLRFFDLVRWGRAENVLNEFLEVEDGLIPHFSGSEVFTAPRNEYWPIQQTQLDLQKGVLKQDPNWIGF